MSNAITPNTEPNEWSSLLRETRLALSTLRDQDLEDLTARAQCMLIAIDRRDPSRQRLPGPGARELLAVTRERRLLSDLLVATQRNLEVINRTCRYGRTHAAEANSPWAR